MKKILINKGQEKIIKENIFNEIDLEKKLPSHLFQDVDTHNTSLKDADIFIKDNFKKLLLNRYKEIKSNFTDDITSYDDNIIANKLNKLISKCIKKESKIKSELEKICANTVTEIFNISIDRNVKIDCKLTEEIDPHKSFHIKPNTNEEYEYENVEEISTNDFEENKRRVINAIVVGGALRITNECENLWIHEIFKLDEELPHLYSQIMKINEYLVFTRKIKIEDNNHKQGGTVEVSIFNNENKSEIKAVGVIFPILLYETLQGVLELYASDGLPKNIDLSKKILDSADALENDPWNMRIGPSLWDKIISNNENIDIKRIPQFISKLSQISSQEFISLMKEITSNTKLGKKNLSDIFISSNDEENDDKIIEPQDNEKDLIEDDYFSEDELNEAIYPEAFNMEEFKNLSSFKNRIAYCKEHLVKIGEGSSRMVFLIDDNTVLKLAKNRKGIAQNSAENDWYLKKMGCFANVYDADENNLWIEMEFAQKISEDEFEALCGFDIYCMLMFCQYSSNLHNNTKFFVDKSHLELFNSEYFKDNFWNDCYSVFSEIDDYIGSFRVTTVGDLGRISSWGVVTSNDGKKHLVLIDYGLNDDVFNNYYKRK